MPPTRLRLFALFAGVALLLVGTGLVAILVARAVTGDMPSSGTHHGSVSVYGKSTSIRGTVHGNLSVQNHATVTVTGQVTGWLHAYGASTVVIDSGARVDGGIRQSTGTLRVQPGAWIGTGLDTYSLSDQVILGGHVAGQVRISASGLQLGPQARVDRDLWVWASRAQVVQVDGTVGGSVHVSGSDLRLGQAAHIGGSTFVYGGKVSHD